MHANMPDVNKYDYNHTKNQMLDIKSKALQQIKVEDIALSNTSCFESNTLKHYFFDKPAITQIQYCLLDKKTVNLPIVRGLPAVWFEEPGNCCR